VLKKIYLQATFLGLIFCLTTCKSQKTPTSEIQTNSSALQSDITLTKIAFGSCAKQDLSQHLWRDIIQAKPDLWIWLGDNIYDTPNATPEKIQQKYVEQKQNADYQAFLKTNTPIIGIWDDNDYGMPDGGKNFIYKKESQKLMLDFLEVPAEAPQRKHEGIYASYIYGKAKRQVKIILLDVRYFRDDLLRDSISKKYIPNENGDMLGETQWEWLENELKNSKAQINIIASGSQIISNMHPFEKWANLPKSRKRLFDMIQKYKPSHTILLTGDRHMGEISQISLPNYKNLYDITSSGITHVGTIFQEENPYRISKQTIHKLHYATIEIDWNKKPIDIVFKFFGEQNHLLLERKK
jgi:alkaline phosphatase D